MTSELQSLHIMSAQVSIPGQRGSVAMAWLRLLLVMFRRSAHGLLYTERIEVVGPRIEYRQGRLSANVKWS